MKKQNNRSVQQFKPINSDIDFLVQNSHARKKFNDNSPPRFHIQSISPAHDSQPALQNSNKVLSQAIKQPTDQNQGSNAVLAQQSIKDSSVILVGQKDLTDKLLTDSIILTESVHTAVMPRIIPQKVTPLSPKGSTVNYSNFSPTFSQMAHYQTQTKPFNAINKPTNFQQHSHLKNNSKWCLLPKTPPFNDQMLEDSLKKHQFQIDVDIKQNVQQYYKKQTTLLMRHAPQGGVDVKPRVLDLQAIDKTAQLPFSATMVSPKKSLLLSPNVVTLLPKINHQHLSGRQSPYPLPFQGSPQRTQPIRISPQLKKKQHPLTEVNCTPATRDRQGPILAVVAGDPHKKTNIFLAQSTRQQPPRRNSIQTQQSITPKLLHQLISAVQNTNQMPEQKVGVTRNQGDVQLPQTSQMMLYGSLKELRDLDNTTPMLAKAVNDHMFHTFQAQSPSRANLNEQLARAETSEVPRIIDTVKLLDLAQAKPHPKPQLLKSKRRQHINVMLSDMKYQSIDIFKNQASFEPFARKKTRDLFHSSSRRPELPFVVHRNEQGNRSLGFH